MQIAERMSRKISMANPSVSGAPNDDIVQNHLT